MRCMGEAKDFYEADIGILSAFRVPRYRVAAVFCQYFDRRSRHEPFHVYSCVHRKIVPSGYGFTFVGISRVKVDDPGDALAHFV
jgi:hypothetical protein